MDRRCHARTGRFKKARLGPPPGRGGGSAAPRNDNMSDESADAEDIMETVKNGFKMLQGQMGDSLRFIRRFADGELEDPTDEQIRQFVKNTEREIKDFQEELSKLTSSD